MTGWEPFLQLGFAAFVATFLLWKHFVYADSIETNNRIHAIGDLGTQRHQAYVIQMLTMILHKLEGRGEDDVCKLVLEMIKQIQKDNERQAADYEAEIRRKK